MQWNGHWDKKYFVLSFYISLWCNYHSLESWAFFDICRYLPIPLLFLNQRSICAIWSEIIKWLFLFLAFCWLQRQGGFYETQRHNGIIRNRAGSHAKVVKGVDDTNISKNREQVIIWFSADYGAEQQKRDKAKKKHAIDVDIVVQWNNHGNDIKKDWT